jgi:hypothetical protein
LSVLTQEGEREGAERRVPGWQREEFQGGGGWQREEFQGRGRKSPRVQGVVITCLRWQREESRSVGGLRRVREESQGGQRLITMSLPISPTALTQSPCICLPNMPHTARTSLCTR